MHYTISVVGQFSINIQNKTSQLNLQVISSPERERCLFLIYCSVKSQGPRAVGPCRNSKLSTRLISEILGPGLSQFWCNSYLEVSKHFLIPMIFRQWRSQAGKRVSKGHRKTKPNQNSTSVLGVYKLSVKL